MVVGQTKTSETEPWRPDALDLYRSNVAYFRFAAGVAILNDPERTHCLHSHDVEKASGQLGIVTHAQTLIWDGLCKVIRYSNPPSTRSPLTRTMTHYAEALPKMRVMVDELAEHESSRLDELLPLSSVLRPLPLTNEAFYKSIAYGRTDKVHLVQAMDVYAISGAFEEGTGRLTFVGLPRVSLDDQRSELIAYLPP